MPIYLLVLLSFLSSKPIFAAPSPKLEEYFGKSTISEIKISGNRLITDKEIIDNIASYPGSIFTKQQILADLQKIYSLGYFEPKSVEAVPYLTEAGAIVLEYKVVENPPVNDLVIYGSNDIENVNAYDIFADLVAKPENAKLIKEKIQTLETEFLKNGFIIAKVNDIELNAAGTLKIYLDEGIIKSISYKGNEKTKRKFLDHLVRDQELGQPYNEFKFANDFRRLQGSGYFSSVTRTVRPAIDGTGGYDLLIDLSEKRTTSVGFGGGVNSSAGIFGNVSMNFGNLRGKGETLNVTGILGSGVGATQTLANNSNLVRRDRLAQVNANYSIPFFLDSPYTLNTFANFLRGPNFNVDLARQTGIGIGTGISRSVGENHFFKVSTSANYIDLLDRDREEYLREVTKNIIKLDDLTPQEVIAAGGKDFIGGRRGMARREAKKRRNSQIVSGTYINLKPSYVYSKLDDRSNPRDGWKTRVSGEPTFGFSDIDSFTRLNASATKYIPVGDESSFLFNARGGAEVFGDIPQFAIYRLGTTAGVRGYRQFSELGVGTRLGIATGEFRTPIYSVIPPLKKYKLSKNVDFALFADAGLIGGRVRLNRITNRLSQAASVGFGLRVKLPLVGALRADIGFPLIDVLTSNKKMFRFNFGPADIF